MSQGIEDLRRAMYDACRQVGLEIVPINTAAKVMAFVGLQGGDERVIYSPRMMCEIQHIQELYYIKGGEVPDADFVLMLQDYTKELKDYTDNHNGEWPQWLNTMIQDRYGFKPYAL